MSEEPTVSATPSGGRRGMGTWADMVRSMGLIAALSLVVMSFTFLPLERDPIQEVDLASIAIGAGKQADFELLVPQLSEDWRPTSARVEPALNDISNQTWHIGYVGPDGKYHALEQSNTVLADRYIEFWTDGLAESAEPAVVGGVQWRLFVGDAGEAVYVYQGAGMTLCVITNISPDGQTLVAATAQQLLS